jgi:hypothetical protein
MTVPLLETLAGLLRRTYALEAPLLPIGRYVIGDSGLRSLYSGPAHEARAAAEVGAGARLLVRETEDGVRACIYFPDAMIRRLESRPPQHGVDDGNVDAFAVLVEELDHLLTTAERAHEGRGISLLELEIQANVSKDLVLARFLSMRGRRLDRGRRTWLRKQLFYGRAYADDDPVARRRYDEAARYALRFLATVERLPAERRLGALRGFHRAPLAVKLQLADAR